MRPIKFKVWNKRTEKMYGPFTIPELCAGAAASGIAVDDTDLVFLQYTGLDDKAGVEIYEGDIVRECEEECPEDVYGTYQIDYSGNGFWPEGRDGNEFGFTSPDGGSDFYVLGNIYQHQDLIQ
jgi:uncharacterized phage protein (TIGR01671 family)